MGTVIDSHFLGLTAIVTVGYQFLFFIVTALLKFHKVTYFADSTNFAIIAILTLILKGTWKFRQIVLTSLVFIWCLRRVLFLFTWFHFLELTPQILRILRLRQYTCLDYLCRNFVKLAFGILQAVWVWTIILPVTVLNSSSRNPSLQAVDIVGWIMWSVGSLLEAIADQQKLVFTNSLENRGRWCNVGLWQYSRHPNYFGKILLWWGIFVASTPVLEGAEWLVILGPIFLTLLLHLFVTSIPFLECILEEKVAEINTLCCSPLILLPPAVYGNLPLWFKATFCCNLPQIDSNSVSNANVLEANDSVATYYIYVCGALLL
ncbi:uncharacterized protein LOC132185380 [Corylus avellana]|uniref:uncharacterized protein LOC132185380 n=1 Tax=Corylus avellana TaxID=13451 RepID=UPI00286AB494|nr:uncharacterized protein LOC132185380 [Corylus avellana]